MEAATEQRADGTTATEEETKAETERLEALLRQIGAEHKISDDYVRPWRNKQLRRLKIYNNQARDESKVGDPLLFTVFQTVFAALYDDRLSAVFEGNDEGDQDTAENLTDLAEHDYRVMQKDEADYDWIWDACFFGRGLLLLNEFDRSPGVMAPVTEVIDPVMWLRDPRATSVNGDQRGRGAMRFGGREISLAKWEMEAIPGYKNLDKLKKAKEYDSATDEVKQQRRAAHGASDTRNEEEALEENYEYTLLEWFTTVGGKKKIITTANGNKLVVREQEIDGDRWPIIDRTLFPVSHDWDGVSIPDLIEDKQRARAKMINLGLDAAIADLHPMYLYNKKKIRNKNDLNFAFNKMVGVSGDVNNAVVPMNKASAVTQQVEYINNVLDVAAQKAVAAPEIAQGVSPAQQRTLGENELVAAARSARSSLSAAIFGWSERRFWNQWYWLYKKHFKDDIDEKIIRIKGPLATSWRTLTRENLVAEVDPDVYVESLRVAEANRKRDFAEFSAFAQIAMQDPQTNRRYLLRRLGRISRLKSAELFLMFPPTIDELKAEDENQHLNDNKFVELSAFDDDAVHLEKHKDAASTPATMAHIEAHKKMMMHKRENPQAFPRPALQQPGMDLNPVSAPQPAPQKSTAPIGQSFAQ
jgi:hypothetical protein